MIPFDTLAELVEIATRPWSRIPWTTAVAPTKDSVELIQQQLGIRIPDYFARLAAVCPSYGAWFASIGPDVDNGLHIIRLNAEFHTELLLEDDYRSHPLPEHFIMLNHGHDGDCDCWDKRVTQANGEHPILHVSVSAGTLTEYPPTFASFQSYIEDFAVHHSIHSSIKAERRRAKRIIEELGIKPQPRRFSQS